MTEYLSSWVQEQRDSHAALLATRALDRVEEIEKDAVEEHILPLQGLAIMLCQRITIDARHGCEALIAEYLAHPPVGAAEAEAELADDYTTAIGVTLLKAAANLKDLTETLFAFDQELGLGHIVPVLKAVMETWQPDHPAEHRLAVLQAMVTGQAVPDPDITRAFTESLDEDPE